MASRYERCITFYLCIILKYSEEEARMKRVVGSTSRSTIVDIMERIGAVITAGISNPSYSTTEEYPISKKYFARVEYNYKYVKDQLNANYTIQIISSINGGVLDEKHFTDSDTFISAMRQLPADYQ